MRHYFLIIFGVLSIFNMTVSYAGLTKRIPEFSNNQVNVWETVMYPSEKQALAMHHHAYNRVVVAFDSGRLKVINNHGQIHYLELVKGKAYFLQKDVIGETHRDENLTDHPIKVMVIELKE